MLQVDLPYLEPLLFFLQKDEALKVEFTEKSFFMPHNDLVTAIEEAAAKSCPMPRALWILPGDTVALAQQEGCKSPGQHTFHIQLIVPCIRDAFIIARNGNDVSLKGQFMELVRLRKLVKEAVHRFYSQYKKEHFNSPKFEKLFWTRDQMLYPQDDLGVLVTAIQFSVNIFP